MNHFLDIDFHTVLLNEDIAQPASAPAAPAAVFTRATWPGSAGVPGKGLPPSVVAVSAWHISHQVKQVAISEAIRNNTIFEACVSSFLTKISIALKA
jgi:hypothetical protein